MEEGVRGSERERERESGRGREGEGEGGTPRQREGEEEAFSSSFSVLPNPPSSTHSLFLCSNLGVTSMIQGQQEGLLKKGELVFTV